ncbi:MAG: MOSC domain-containing protein [Acidobacteriota bacterium]
MTDAPGTLEAIWLKRAKRGPMDAADQAHLRAGAGLDDDANNHRRLRQVTVISADVWDDVQRELDAAVAPDLRRANLMVRGLDLENSLGRTLAIGDGQLRIHGETRPCDRMDEGHPGLQAALDPHWRGGVYGEALNDADIAVGDAVRWLDD